MAISLGIGTALIGLKKRKPVLLGFGGLLLSIKPINVVMFGLFLLKSIWDWSLREKIFVSLPVLFAFIFSFPIFGFNWPLRYITALEKNSPQVFLANIH